MADEGPLACPRCAIRYPLEERFCAECEMPLVYVGRDEMAPVTDAHGRARKVKPQYTRGELVRVAAGRNLAEAEMIQGMLLEEGIPSMLRRMRGFDVPDFLAAGPRDVLVPQSAVPDARELLEVGEEGAAESAARSVASRPAPVKLLAWILVAVALGSGMLALLERLN